MSNVYVKYQKLQIVGEKKIYQDVAFFDVKIIPIDKTDISLYPDIPLSRAYNVIVGKYTIKKGDRFIILNPYNSGLPVNKILYCYDDFVKHKILNNFFSLGIAILDE